MKKQYAMNDVIYSLMRLYPGQEQDIFYYEKRAEEEFKTTGLDEKDKIDYVECFILDKLD